MDTDHQCLAHGSRVQHLAAARRHTRITAPSYARTYTYTHTHTYTICCRGARAVPATCAPTRTSLTGCGTAHVG